MLSCFTTSGRLQGPQCSQSGRTAHPGADRGRLAPAGRVRNQWRGGGLADAGV